RPEVLVAVCAPGEAVAPPHVTGHHRHVLHVAFAALFAYRTVMRMVDHQPFDHAGTEGNRIGVADGDTQAVRRRGHAGHDEAAMLVMLVAELLHGALPAGAHRPESGMAAEVGHVETEREQGVQQVIALLHLVVAAVDANDGHALRPRYGQAFSRM